MTAMLRACVRVWVWVCVGVPAQAQNTAPHHLQLLYVSDVFGVKVIEKLKVEENDKGTLRPVCCFFLRDAQTHTHTHTRIPGSLNRAKRRSRNHKVVGSIPG